MRQQLDHDVLASTSRPAPMAWKTSEATSWGDHPRDGSAAGTSARRSGRGLRIPPAPVCGDPPAPTPPPSGAAAASQGVRSCGTRRRPATLRGREVQARRPGPRGVSFGRRSDGSSAPSALVHHVSTGVRGTGWTRAAAHLTPGASRGGAGRSPRQTAFGSSAREAPPDGTPPPTSRFGAQSVEGSEAVPAAGRRPFSGRVLLRVGFAMGRRLVSGLGDPASHPARRLAGHTTRNVWRRALRTRWVWEERQVRSSSCRGRLPTQRQTTLATPQTRGRQRHEPGAPGTVVPPQARGGEEEAGEDAPTSVGAAQTAVWRTEASTRPTLESSGSSVGARRGRKRPVP